MMRKIITGLSLILWSLTTQAQVKTVTTYLKSAAGRADHLYENRYYKEAVDLYQQALRKDPTNSRVKLQLAESFRKLNDPAQAAQWYRQVIHEDIVEAPHKLHYAQALLSSGQPELAKEWYARYQQDHTNDRRVANQLNGIKQLSSFYRDSLMFTVQPMNINSGESDFAPAFYQDGLVFISARETKQAVKQVFRWNETPYVSMFFSPLDSISGKARDVLVFGNGLKSNYHEGPVVFYENDTRIIFTRNTPGESKGEKVNRLGLFTAQKSKSGSGWTSPTALPFNNPAYSVGHPALTEDGQTLYFVSDMPGGFGGTDLYTSQLVDGTWQPPTNLGPAINTEGNEVFPFLHADQTLYFASNGWGGLGGLDIYRTELNSQRVENVGYPVNSSYDDFSFILNQEGKKGFFASNRGNRAEDDDLYQVAVHVHFLEILVTSEDSQQPLSEAEVSLIGDGAIEHIALSDQNGSVRFQVNPHNTYIVNVDKNGFEGSVEIISSDDLLAAEADQTVNIVLTESSDDAEEVAVVITNGYTDQPVPYTLVEVTNAESNDTKFRLTDGEGIIRIKAQDHHRYTFSGEFEGSSWKYPEVAVRNLKTDTNKKITVTTPRAVVPLRVKVADADTHQPLEHVAIRLIEDGDQRAELHTSAQGSASFKVDPLHNYLLSVEALTHYDEVAIVTSEELMETSQHYVEVLLTKAEKTVNFTTTLYDSATNAPLPHTIVRLRGDESDEELTGVSNEQGIVQFKVAPNSSYQATIDTDRASWTVEESVVVTEDGTAKADWRIPVSQLSSPNKPDKALAQRSDRVVLPIKIIDKQSSQPLAQADVILIGDGVIDDMATSNNRGMVRLDVENNKIYIIDVSKDNYQGNALIVEANQLATGEEKDRSEIVIALQPQTGKVDLITKVYNTLNDQPLAHTLIQLVNTTTGDTINQVTNDQGEIGVKVDGRSTYRISARVGKETWKYADVDSQILAAEEPNQIVIPVEVPVSTTPLRVITRDADTQQPVEHVVVRLIKDGAQQDVQRTDLSGEAVFKVNPDESYLVSVEPLAHYDDVAIVMSEELEGGTEYPVELWLNSAQGTVGVQAQLYDSISKRPLANTVVRIQHERSGEEITALSDERGNIRMKIEPGASYKIAGRMTDQVWSFDTSLETNAEESSPLTVKIPIFEPVSYEGLLADAQSGHSLAYAETSPNQISEKELKDATFITTTSSLSNSSSPLQVWVEMDDQLYRLSSEGSGWYLLRKKGKKMIDNDSERADGWWRTVGKKHMTINNIHFGFDKFSISSEAAEELDKIVALMKRQPTLRIEASTHTDSRGPSSYNLTLSQKRAQAILYYLTEKGIDRKRVYLNFYGEERPLRPCASGTCNEDTHQINRRAEFILNFI